MRQRSLDDRLEAALGVRPTGRRSLSGGSINDAYRVDLPDGSSVFAKTHPEADSAMFPAEAAGLMALGAATAAGGPPVPEVLHAAPDLLVLQWFAPGRVGPDGWKGFGRALAELHRLAPPGLPRHGFDGDNFIGATAQPNTWTGDGIAFFSEHRIGFQVRLARDRGLLSAAHAAQADRFRTRLADLLAPCAQEPPALLHGDLWSGNVHGRQDGVVCLIDPAAHYGLREADLAMTRLFGSLPGDFYAAYDEAYPLPPGVAERVEVFNLYHLLNHLNLFGGGYLGQVLTILGRLG